MATFRRPLYSGSGHRLYNGAGLALTYEFEADSLEAAIFDLLTEVRAVLGGPGSTVFQMLGASEQQIAAVRQYAQGAMLVGAVASLVAPEVGVPVALGGQLIDFLATQDWGGDVEVPAYMPGNQLDRIYSGDQPVVPVTPPPSGYGGSAVASAIWDELLDVDEHTGLGTVASARYIMRQLLNHHLWAGQYQGWVSKNNPLFRFFQQWTSANYAANYFEWDSAPPNPPSPDWTLWDGSESVVDFLNDHAPGNGWSLTDPWGATGPLAWSPAVGEQTNLWWRCEVLPWMLPYVSGRAFNAIGQGGGSGAPIWPGLAGVTLGTPVELTDDGRVEATMDGVLIEITAMRQGSGRIEFTNQDWWYRAGFLAFEDGDGNAERHDYLNRQFGVYPVQTMVQASAVVVHLDRASAVTVTPWVRNA